MNNYNQAGNVFFGRDKMIDAIHKDNMEKMRIDESKAQMESDLRNK